MEWVINNKEWLFSGVAIAIPIAVIGWFITTKKTKWIQKGGDNSTNVKVGGNIIINNSKGEKNND